MPEVETSTPANTPEPIGPYSHVARVGNFITIGGTAGVDPATGELAGTDIGVQTRQILESFRVMLESVGSDLVHVVHVNIFLSRMSDFEGMNAAYMEKMGAHRPARTVVGVRELPKPGVLLTMNLTAVTIDLGRTPGLVALTDEVPQGKIRPRVTSRSADTSAAMRQTACELRQAGRHQLTRRRFQDGVSGTDEGEPRRRRVKAPR